MGSVFAYYFLAAFDFGNKRFARLKARNEMLVNNERGILGDVAGYFAGALLVYKRAEATHVNVVALSHRVLHYFEEGFYGCQHIGFFDAGFLRNFGNYLSFGHVGKGVLEVKKNDMSDGFTSGFRRKPLPGKGFAIGNRTAKVLLFFRLANVPIQN